MIEQILLSADIAIGMLAGALISPYYDLGRAYSVKLKTEEGKFEPVIDTPRKKHGLIVFGSGDAKFNEIVSDTSDLVYRALKDRSYNDDNLYILGEKEYLKEGLDCHILPSSKKQLVEVLQHLYKDVSCDDSFFMYIFNHGFKTGGILPIGQSVFSLDEGIVREEELEELLSDLHPNYSITYFNNCFSGGFALRLGKGRNIAISTSKKSKVTLGRCRTEESPGISSLFTHFFYSSSKDASIDEAFDFATLKQVEFILGLFKRREIIKRIRQKQTPHLVYGKINPRSVKL